jgi:serine/threonine protein kinase
MAERTDTNQGPSGPPKQTEQQETMLLGDVPDVSELMPEASAQATNAPHLSSVALAALTQRYEILGEAGHGSMGNVYKARDRETGEIVALKLLKPEIASDQAMMDRFKNELLFARKITHKNVCRVHEFNRLGGIAYTSMEFVEGESLRSVLNRFGGLPVRKATDLALQICSGLKEAHAQGIVHRDLKPENIMIDAQGNVKIMDFGIARSMEAVTRMTGSMVGTPAYMAPEQVAGKPVDYRTDVYSLGLILYEMFTGAAAFRADNAVAVALKQMRESPTPPHEIDPQIPAPIERTILKCLEKEPSKRFQSIAELDSALRPQGAGSAAALASVPSASISPTHTTQATLPLPSPPLRLMPPPPRRRVSPAVWVLLLLFIALAAIAGERSEQIQQETAALPPPAPLPAPKPPDFAFEIPPRPVAQPQPAQAQPAQPQPVAAPKPAAPKPEKQAAAKAAEPASSPQDVQQRADKAFGENQSGGAFTGLDNRPGYIWVGRFEREDRARSASKKIEDLGGMRARVVPRWNEKGKFFVVFTGPFAAKSLPGIRDWLHAQGFEGAHEVRVSPSEMQGLEDQQQNAEPWRKANQSPNQ